MTLIPTAIVAPQRKQTPIRRAIIENLTGKVDASRLTIVNSPAGSGKTTAALDWFERLTAAGRPGLWIASRAGIHDLRTFRIALKSAGIAAGLPWEGLDPDSGADSWLIALAAHTQQRPLIVIEDAQLLSGAVLEFLGQWIACARDAVTTVIVSRGEVSIPTARMRSLGLLVDVGWQELQFSQAESLEYLTAAIEGSLDSDLLREISRQMGGWVSGLVLAAEHIGRLDRRGLASRNIAMDGILAGIARYFEEEILGLQQDRIREFIGATSVLATLTPAACMAVLDDREAGETLGTVHRSGLFLSTADAGKNSYGYHPLFRRLVYQAMADRFPALASEYHRRASRQFASLQDGLQAIEHARASRDDEFLADQLELLSNSLITNGYLYLIDDVASRLPWTTLRTRPMLLLALAWRRTRRFSLVMAERYIATAESIAAEQRPDDLTLSNLIRHRRILLEAARENLHHVETEGEKLLLELGDEEPYLSCSLVGQLMLARREHYHFRDIVKLEAETNRALERPGSEFASINLKATVAPTLMALGKAALSRRLLEEALKLAETRCGVGSSVAALPALMLAEALYDIGDLDRAEQLVDAYLPVIRQWGMVDELSAGFLTRARLHFARGETGLALSTLDEAHLVAVECSLDRLRAIVVAQQVQIFVRTGQVGKAEAALRAGDIVVDGLPYPTLTPSRRNEHVAIAWLRIEIARFNLARARKVAVRWLEFVRRNAARRSIVTFQLLLAEIAMLEGDRPKARRALREALSEAEPGQWMRIFLDEGEAITGLLVESYAGGPAAQVPVDAFAASLVTKLGAGVASPMVAHDKEQDASLASPLIEREVEILVMINSGLRNREIGERLGLTEGTVKWYLQQIFDKLGVRRRSQAVLNARQLGIFG